MLLDAERLSAEIGRMAAQRLRVGPAEDRPGFRRPDDQRPGLVGGHGSARLGDLVDRASCHLLVLDAHKLVEEVAAFSGHPIARAELHQKVPHLGLEYDDERDHAHVDESSQQGVHQLHVERRHDHPQHEKQDDGDEYIHCRRPSYPPECQVDEYCDH